MKQSLIALFAGCGAIALSGCGGSGGSAFAPASFTSGSGGSVASKIGKRPIGINMPTNVLLVAVAPNGKMIGNANGNTGSYFWSSPTATPQVLQTGGYGSVQVTGINNAGQMVGSGTPSGGNQTPIYWASPTSAPVALQVPLPQTDAVAIGINASGQIVGFTGVGNAEEALYWATSTSAPAVLAGIGGGSSQGPAAALIADTGQIYGLGDYGYTKPATWLTPTSNAQVLATPAGTSMEQIINVYIGICPETGDAGSNLSADGGVTSTPIVWPAAGLAETALTAPAGATGLMYLEGIAKNHVAFGAASNATSQIAVEWNGFSNPYTDLNSLLPAGTGWTLQAAVFMDDAGDIIGYGKKAGSQYIYFAVNFS